MPEKKLTEFFVKHVAPPVDGRDEYFDARKGLTLRVTARGVKSWSVYDRLATGEKFRFTIGEYPRVGLAAAGREAERVLQLVREGKDPRQVKAAERAAEAERNADTVAVVAGRFIAKHLAGHRSGEAERILRREIIPVWGQRPISAISRRDVIDLVDEIADRAPVLGNRALARLKTFFAWCLDRDIIGADPTARIRKPRQEKSRERVLTDAEIAAFWRGCALLSWPFGPLFQLLALTAQRKSEIGGLVWNEINFDDRLIEIKGDRYKTGRPHVVPLSRAAVDIVRSLPQIGDRATYVFTTTGREPVSGYSRAKATLDAHMREELGDLPHWTLHDLRRTARTNFSKLGVPADIAERVLGHVVGGVRAVYDRHSFVPQMRDALERWAAHVAGIVAPQPDKVVKLTRRVRP